MSLQYIIDGYNLINNSSFIRGNKDVKKPSLLAVRAIKTRRLTGSLKNKVSLVFDGYPPFDTEESDAQINIIYSRKITADEKIKKMVEESANRRSIVVVSNDREIIMAVKSLGAQHVTVEEFIAEKTKSSGPGDKETFKSDLNYSQIEEINQELKKIWLK